MELAGQLSMISVGIGIILVAYPLIKHFRRWAHQKKSSPANEADSGQ